MVFTDEANGIKQWKSCVVALYGIGNLILRTSANGLFSCGSLYHTYHGVNHNAANNSFGINFVRKLIKHPFSPRIAFVIIIVIMRIENKNSVWLCQTADMNKLLYLCQHTEACTLIYWPVIVRSDLLPSLVCCFELYLNDSMQLNTPTHELASPLNHIERALFAQTGVRSGYQLPFWSDWHPISQLRRVSGSWIDYLDSTKTLSVVW